MSLPFPPYTGLYRPPWAPPFSAWNRLPRVPLLPASNGLDRRSPSPNKLPFSHLHTNRWRCIRSRIRQWSQIISAHAGYFQSGISSRIISFSSSFGRHSFEFRRVLTAARQQWTLNSDSELDFDGFVTVEFGENGHFAANLAPETMSIEFFFFLTGSSDVNSDSSDAHSASVAMSLTATILRHPDVG